MSVWLEMTELSLGHTGSRSLAVHQSRASPWRNYRSRSLSPSPNCRHLPRNAMTPRNSNQQSHCRVQDPISATQSVVQFELPNSLIELVQVGVDNQAHSRSSS